MSRKKKYNTVQRSNEKRDEELSPFSSIVLKEKKEEKKHQSAAKKAVSHSGKKPQQIVQGYDPNASFSDILYNWEHTGELYALPKNKASKIAEGYAKKQSFADILAKWEGKPAVKPRQDGEVKRVSPAYKPSKDFGSILDQYEGKAPSRSAVSVSEAENSEKAAEPQNKSSNPFFKEKEEDDERPSSVAWSIYGENRKIEREVKAEPVKEEKKDVSEYKRTSREYKPSKDFGSILDSYEGKVEKKQIVEELASVVTAPAKPQEKVEGTTFFRKAADEERPSTVAWSVLGGNREIRREEKREVKKEHIYKETEEREKSDKVEAKPSELFKKSVSTMDVKTFDEILKEKGDLEKLKKEKSINEIRMMLPQATLDLHGMTQVEAEKAVLEFLAEADTHLLDKVAIIHGKGLHAEDGQGVLKELTYRLCRDSEFVREYTVPKAQYGGSGALWIILKRRKAEAE